MEPIKVEGNVRARVILGGAFGVRNFPRTIGSSVAGVVVSIPPTAGAPTVPTGLATEPGANKVTLTWNASAGATGYKIQRDGAGVLVVLGAVTTYDDESLTGANIGTLHPYAVLALNGVGESAYCSAVQGGTLTNEIQRVAFGTIASPIAGIDGFLDLEVDGEIVSVVYNSTQGATQGLIDAAFGSGKIQVQGDAPVFDLKFNGTGYAATDVDEATIDSSTLKKAAEGTNVAVTQTGVADTSGTPTLGGSWTPGVDAAGAKERQRIDFQSNLSGSFDLTYTGGSPVNFLIGISDPQTVIDSVLGSMGVAAVFNSDSSGFDVEWNTEVTRDTLSISNVIVPGTTPGVNVITEGVNHVDATYGVRTVTFTPAATSGSWSINGGGISWNDGSGSTGAWSWSGAASSGGSTVTSATTGSGPTEPTISGGGLSYGVTGQPTIVVVSLTSTPDAGKFVLSENGSPVGSAIAYNGDAAALEAQISSYGGGYEVDGAAMGPWTLTSSTNVAHAWTCTSDSGDRLRKDLGAEVDTLTDGGDDPS